MGPTLGFLPPLECQKHDTGPPLGPQENVIDSEGKLPTENQPPGSPASLSEAGSQRPGGAREPRIHPAPESPISAPACPRRLLNPQPGQKDSPSCL